MLSNWPFKAGLRTEEDTLKLVATRFNGRGTEEG